MKIKRLICLGLINSLPASSLYSLKNYLLRVCGVKIGNNVKVNSKIHIYGNYDIAIGNNTWIGPNCKIYCNGTAKIMIGSNCDIAPDVVFVTGSHKLNDESSRRAGEGFNKTIIIEDGCWIGIRCTILGGSMIKSSSVVGACTLINQEYANNSVIVGNPGRIIKFLSSIK